MTAQEFINKYYPYAAQAQKDSGIVATASLAQSALETGWGKSIPGNMMFGIKAGSSWKGEKQLVTTTEVHDTATVKYPVVISVTKRSDGKYLYKVKDWFRAYPTPYESFMDYAALIKNNARYKRAYANRGNVEQYFKEMAAAGYATDPAYFKKMMDMVASVSQRISTWAKRNPAEAATLGLGTVAGIVLLFFCSPAINSLI